MKNIEIRRDGRVVSAVVFGTDLGGFVSCGGGKHFLIYDSAVEVHASALSEVVGFAGKFAVEGVSEERKSMGSVLEICRWLLACGADRNSVVVALGGGILLDMVGFAAGIYKRGVRCIYVPTTLLAQVDAAIGGKTGVNLDGYKNILGVFRQPELTYICPQVLETLPPAIFRDGLAEMLKTFIIDNGDGRVERMLKAVRWLDEVGGFGEAVSEVRGEFGELVAMSAGVKAGVVERDEFEGGERRKLNLGHTFAHAIEYVAHSRAERVSHGEAVAMGLAMAAGLSVRVGVAEAGVERDVVEALEVCGLPVRCPYEVGELVDAMSKDKKVDGDK
ncbi:MAG: 3-dehydroquinate synthase, partial [Bacteroidales bacterium]|nr:3-dehydroquinate synthase [Bacteroidales bacterium]